MSSNDTLRNTVLNYYQQYKSDSLLMPTQPNLFYENFLQHQNYLLQQHQQHQNYAIQSPRSHEEPKPSHSYIGLIAMAILSNPDKKMVLSDIYQWILDNYLYFRNRGPGWRNSIRHNLSLNDCFIKAGRSANGKGHYWAIHPANLEDFQKGDFRRRRAQRRVRKSLGLIVPEEEDDEDDDDDDEIPSPSTLSPLDTIRTSRKRSFDDNDNEHLPKKLKTNNKSNNLKSTLDLNGSTDDNISISEQSTSENSSLFVTQDSAIEENDICIKYNQVNNIISPSSSTKNTKKRGFDVDDILAPDRQPKTMRFNELKQDNSNELLNNHNIYSNMQNSNYQLGLNQALFYRNYYLMQQKDPMFFYHFQSALHNQTKNLLSSDQVHIKQAKQPTNINNNIDAENWKRTFEKIMARSYKNQNTHQVDEHKHGTKRKLDQE